MTREVDPDHGARHSYAVRDVEAGRLLNLALAQEPEHALILLDVNACVMSWSTAAVSTFGWEADEMLGQTLERLFTPEDLARGDYQWELRAALSYGKAEDDRWQVRKDGMRIWANGVLTALHDEHGAVVGFVKIARDRTDVRSQLETLQSRVNQASSAEHDKHVLLGTLAHELRNPLGPLATAAQIIRHCAPDKPQIASSVQIIERQVRFIASLVEDLFETTRVAVGKVQLHYDSIELRSVIDNAIETCSAMHNEREQSVEVVMPEELGLDADAVRLQQVIVNLLTNSSKFSPPGTRTWIKVTVEGDEVVIRVEDRGKGIPAELLPRIFELFTQAGAERQIERTGLGLGLGLVKSIVELHGGSVQAKSEGAGKGTEIIVRVPLKRAQYAQIEELRTG